MRLILDASVAVCWVLAERESPKAQQLREDYRKAVCELLAPESFLLECANSLTKKERQRLIPDARLLWDELMLDAPAFFSILPLTDRALTISLQTRHNFFDCLYVALAEQEGCELVTIDQKFIANLQPTFPLIRPLATLP